MCVCVFVAIYKYFFTSNFFFTICVYLYTCSNSLQYLHNNFEIFNSNFSFCYIFFYKQCFITMIQGWARDRELREDKKITWKLTKKLFFFFAFFIVRVFLIIQHSASSVWLYHNYDSFFHKLYSPILNYMREWTNFSFVISRFAKQSHQTTTTFASFTTASIQISQKTFPPYCIILSSHVYTSYIIQLN